MAVQKQLSEAARVMGRVRSVRKAEAARQNGLLGGRPPGIRHSRAVRLKLALAQQARRARERGGD